MIDFARPAALWLLTLAPPLAAWVALGSWRRSAGWYALGQSSRLRRDGGWGWFVAILCLVVALAQPRWGRGSAPPLPPGHDVVLLVDTSRSMGVEDAVPNRLGVAVESARSLLDALGLERGNRVAVVAFAGRGRLRCPLTENLGAAAEALGELRPGDLRPGGTNLGAGLEAALEAFDSQDHAEGRTIVLFSDGEDHAGTWTPYVELLRGSGIVVHSIAIGDPAEGHDVPSGRGSSPLTFQGSPVRSKREDRASEALAKATGGAFVPLGQASADLGRLYRTRIAPVARQRRSVVHPAERAERYPLFVAAALVLGLWGSRSRPRRGFGPRRWLVLGVATALGAGGVDTVSPALAVADGRSAYAAGRYADALAAFERAIALDPGAAVPRYDAGSALFRLERYQEAMTRYGEARERADSRLRTKIDFALGNTSLALGDVAAALEHYDQCLASTTRGTGLDAVRRDAAINRRYAEEQSPPPPVPPDQDRPSSSAPNRARAPNSTGEQDGRSEEGAAKGGNPGPGQEPEGLGSSRRRGAGGAGGSGPAPARAGSPEARLTAALEQIREARSRRLDEGPPPPDEQVKDW